MQQLIQRVRGDERGTALITALSATMVMLALGLALLSIVDTQADGSASERTRDRGFNLAESVLSSEAFVLGRNWPATAPATGNPTCSAAGVGFGDTLGSTAPAAPAVQRLRKTLNESYTDSAYAGATWLVNLCDDNGSTVWSDSLLNTQPTWDFNANKKIWVVAQSVVGGVTRKLVGLVLVRENAMIPAKYGLVSGGMTDDLGSTVNVLSQQALGGVLGGLLGTTPTVAPDPTLTTAPVPPSGVIGLRCGATDLNLIPASTCVAGTIGALGALPVVQNLLTGGKLAQYPTLTTATRVNIDQLRSQAIAAGTYSASSSGAATATTNQACELTGSPTADSVVFIERVGGNGDHYCVVDVSAGVKYKALVIGSGRVILRGNGTATGTPTTSSAPQVNTFSGVVYALNRQRLPVAEGGHGLGDSAAPGREVVRIENGAHIKGGVYADGKSAKVSVYPPPLTVNTNQLRDQLCAGNYLTCLLGGVLNVVGSVLSVVTSLVNVFGVGPVVNGLLGQLNPQRATYGSAIVSDVAAINSLTVYGASGVVPGSFRDLQAR